MWFCCWCGFFKIFCLVNVVDSVLDDLASNLYIMIRFTLGDTWHPLPQDNVNSLKQSHTVPGNQGMVPTSSRAYRSGYSVIHKFHVHYYGNLMIKWLRLGSNISHVRLIIRMVWPYTCCCAKPTQWTIVAILNYWSTYGNTRHSE